MNERIAGLEFNGNRLATRWPIALLGVSAMVLGLTVAPSTGASQAASTGAGSVLSSSSLAVLAVPAAVRGRRVMIRVKGKKFGKKARVTLTCVKGNCLKDGGAKTRVWVKRKKTVAGLRSGKYTVKAKKITSKGVVAEVDRIEPRLVSVKKRRGAATTVTYRRVQVSPPRPVTIMSGGGLDTSGKVWRWVVDRVQSATALTAKAVAGSHVFTQISTSGGHSCGVDSSGRAWCWGRDNDGQLGNGPASGSDQDAPVAVAGGHTFKSVAVGGWHTCGVDTAGKAWCWGQNFYGQTGDGSTSGYKHVPVAVAGGHRFIQIAAGDRHSCGVGVYGKAWCWGRDSDGQAGDGSADQSRKWAPVAVSTNRRFNQITAGDSHSCGLSVQGKAWCWGRDSMGQVGNGPASGSDQDAPVAVVGGHRYSQVAAGGFNTCAVGVRGKAWCWGMNYQGQVGIGNDEPGRIHTPAAVLGGHRFTQVGVGGRTTTCGRDTSGKPWCWGYRIWRREIREPVAVIGDLRLA